MLKLFIIVPLLVAVVPSSCNKTPSALRESCEVLKATMYVDGEFVLNAEERKGLRWQNKEKLVNLIQFYQAKCLK